MRILIFMFDLFGFAEADELEGIEVKPDFAFLGAQFADQFHGVSRWRNLKFKFQFAPGRFTRELIRSKSR